MTYKEMFLEKATKWVVGGDLYAQVKELVAMYTKEDGLSGSEKRDAVIKKAKSMFTATAGVLINIALEVAVFIITEKVKV